MFDPPVHRRAGHRHPRTERIIIRLTPEGLAAIDALAKKEQRTRSDMVRILLNRGLERP